MGDRWGNSGCVMMLCWGREGQVDDGPLVLAGLCWSMTSPPSQFLPHSVCSDTCPSSEFHCSNGCCIDSYLECDGTPDCSDASDEAACDECKAWEVEEWWAAGAGPDNLPCIPGRPLLGLCL